MGKSFGLAAFVVLLVSLPIPVLGNYVSLLAILLLCVAAYQGERNWTITVDIIAWVKMFVLSPTWHLMMFGGGYMRGMTRDLERSGMADPRSSSMIDGNTRTMEGLNATTLLVTVAILAAPIVIMLWRSRAQPTDAGSSADA